MGKGTRCLCLALIVYSTVAPFSSASEKSDLNHIGPPPAREVTFAQAVELGMQSNLDLLAAQYNVPIAKADELTTGLWTNPELSMDATLQPFGRNWNQTTAGGPRQFDVAVSYPIDYSGKKRKARKSAKVATQVAEASFQDAVRLKVLDIRLAYIDVMFDQAIVSLSEEKEVNLQQLVTFLQSRIGRQDILPLLQARAQLALDQARIETRQKGVELENASHSLALLLGRTGVGSSLVFSTRLRDFSLTELPDEKDVLDEALANRPDMTASRLTRAKALADRQFARAQRWDNLTLNMGYTSQGPVDANPNDATSRRLGHANDWSAALSIPLPLFDRNQGNIRKADLTVQQLEKQLAAKELSIRQEIAALENQLRLNLELIKQYESAQLKNAQLIRDTQQKLYSTGASAFLEYLDAIEAYHETLIAYYTVLAAYRRNVARLDAAVSRDIL